jgi:hypothetical protein
MANQQQKGVYVAPAALQGYDFADSYTPRVLIGPLHSKTASKADASLWIPAGCGQPPKLLIFLLLQKLAA